MNQSHGRGRGRGRGPWHRSSASLSSWDRGGDHVTPPASPKGRRIDFVRATVDTEYYYQMQSSPASSATTASSSAAPRTRTAARSPARAARITTVCDGEDDDGSRSTTARSSSQPPPSTLFAVAPGGVPIMHTAEYLSTLEAMVHSVHELGKKGYVMQQLSEGDLRKKMKCRRCRKTINSSREGGGKSKYEAAQRRKARVDQGDDSNGPASCEDPDPLPATEAQNARLESAASAKQDEGGNNGSFDNKMGDQPSASAASGDGSPLLEAGICHYHKEVAGDKHCIRCRKSLFAKGCLVANSHTPMTSDIGELSRHWRYACTPPPHYLSPSSRLGMPACEPREAVVIDCEMGTSTANESELIRVSAIDYFTAEVILDSLVWPEVDILHYNTRYSGITAGDMRAARREDRCFVGRDAARRALWARGVVPSTIVIGHSVNGDLKVLRWIHGRIVDTLLVESARRRAKEEAAERADEAEREARRAQEQEQEEKEEAKEAAENEGTEETEAREMVAPVAGETQEAEARDKANGSSKRLTPMERRERRAQGMSLQALAKSRLGRDIQRGAHDSVEDALATRDLLHWLIMNPQIL